MGGFFAVAQRRISDADGERTFEALMRCKIERRKQVELGQTAWSIAKEYGWSRTDDAEYVALARLLGRPLVTLDR